MPLARGVWQQGDEPKLGQEGSHASTRAGLRDAWSSIGIIGPRVLTQCSFGSHSTSAGFLAASPRPAMAF